MKRLILTMLLLGCNDSKETDAADPDSDTTSDTTEAAWADMDRAARLAYMTDVFLPEIKDIMVDHDAGYSSMSCTTCHGDDMVAADYAMPNGLVPFSVMELPLPGSGGVADLMYDEVVPKAAELLGYEPYDFATREGFGCYGCHDQP